MILLVWWYNSSLEGKVHDEVLLDSIEDAQEIVDLLEHDFPNGQRERDYGITEQWLGAEYYTIQRIA